MFSRKTLTRFLVGAACAGAMTAAGIVTGPAGAAPLPVTQIPSPGLQVSGLVVPSPLFVGITADSTNRRGWTAFTAPATPEVCSSSAGGMLVSIDWLNTSTGRTGNVWVKPCYYFIDPTPTRVEAQTGSGQIVFSAWIRGSALSPSAGQPALPGGGTFFAP